MRPRDDQSGAAASSPSPAEVEASGPSGMASSKEPRGPENGARDLAVEDISSGDVEEYNRVLYVRPLVADAACGGCICILDVNIDGAIVAAPQVDRREAAPTVVVHDRLRLPIDDALKERTDRIMMLLQPRSTMARSGTPRVAAGPSRHLLLMGWRAADGRIGR